MSKTSDFLEGVLMAYMGLWEASKMVVKAVAALAFLLAPPALATAALFGDSSVGVRFLAMALWAFFVVVPVFSGIERVLDE